MSEINAVPYIDVTPPPRDFPTPPPLRGADAELPPGKRKRWKSRDREERAKGGKKRKKREEKKRAEKKEAERGEAEKKRRAQKEARSERRRESEGEGKRKEKEVRREKRKAEREGERASEENAIFKASPLSFSGEARFYEYLKEFNFVFKPES